MTVLMFKHQPGLAQLHQFKPGFNLFTKDQDIQLGKEAAAEVEKQVEVVNNAELNAYIALIGSRLSAQPQAAPYPYPFKVVSDSSINAFALPGGPGQGVAAIMALRANQGVGSGTQQGGSAGSGAGMGAGGRTNSASDSK